MIYEIPREEVVLDERVNMARRLNSIKVKRTPEAVKQILRYRIVGDKKELTNR